MTRSKTSFAFAAGSIRTGSGPAGLVSVGVAVAAGVFLAAGLASPPAAVAHEPGDAGMDTPEASVATADTTNPLRTALEGFMGRYRGNIVRAAELMPAEHYDYKPTENKRTFAGELAHVAGSSVSLCRALAGPGAPEAPDMSGLHDGGKEALVTGLEEAFGYCEAAIATFADGSRGETVTLFGEYRDTKAMAALILAADWGDHYGHLATYMRLNDLLPPTAREGSED